MAKSYWDGNEATRELAERCNDGKPIEEVVRELDENGNTVMEFSLLKSLRNSPYAKQISMSETPCDPTRADNLIQVNQELSNSLDIADEGDNLVSLRNLQALGLFSREGGACKRLYFGSFFRQHSVQYIGGSRVLVFDNLGMAGQGGPSRVVQVDLSTGEETVIYPSPRIPEEYNNLYSENGSVIRVSQDRSRIFVLFAKTGKGLEIDLETGEALRLFRNIHNVQGAGDFPEEESKTKAGLFRATDLRYMNDNAAKQQ
jgi:hypothetical protein